MEEKKEKQGLSISVGVCAYNEEKNIEFLLKSILRQKLRKVFIEEIIVISDGSFDRTGKIVTGLCCDREGLLRLTFGEAQADGEEQHIEIKLVEFKERCGKYKAINEFIKIAKAPILVLASADIILSEDAIENLCLPFLLDKNMGITGSRPIPKDQKDSFLGFVVNLQWVLHHELSLLQPKFGELIAFRNIIDKLPVTSVDEEQIAAYIKTKGFVSKYIPEAIIYNKGPDNIRDFLRQRRRIYSGHLILSKRYSYKVATFSGIRILKYLLKDSLLDYRKNKLWLCSAIFLELIGRILGKIDVFFGKNHYKWKIAASTKRLND